GSGWASSSAAATWTSAPPWSCSVARSRFGAAAVLSAFATVGASAGWIGLRLLHGHLVPWFGLFYNLPIALAFVTLAAEVLLSAVGLTGYAFARRYRGILIAWGLGVALLYLRLVTKSIDVSGHAAWSVLMLAHAITLRAPFWLVAYLLAVLVQVLALKWIVLGGHSGLHGLLAGLLLAFVLWVLQRDHVQGE